MAADTHAGLMDVRVWLAVGGFDCLRHVDADRIGIASEFVRERDVDVAIDAFRQLGELRGLRVADAQKTRRLKGLVIEGLRLQPAGFIHGPNDLRICAQIAEDLAGRHAFRTGCEQHLMPLFR